MKKNLFGFILVAMMGHGHAETSLTIYNQNFGVVRDVVPLDLQPGINQVNFASATAHLEPDSVILRDPKSGVKLSIVEQNYRADPVSQGLLLHLNEGKEIEFAVRESNQPERTVRGKIIRSGYERGGNAVQPVIEVDGKLQFSLPGEPRFTAFADDTILKPTLEWRIFAEEAAKLDAELCYVTRGMSWEASYNVVAPEAGDVMDFTGWITIANRSGKEFKDARLQFIAGDVSKLNDAENSVYAAATPMRGSNVMFDYGARRAKVTEEAFDEFHLYSVPMPATLHDDETKQVEFARAEAVKSQRIFIYDGADFHGEMNAGWDRDRIRGNSDYGTVSNPKVWIMREVKNSETNHLGLPLPKGKVRFYRKDRDGRLHFTGEDRIDHTARDETLRLYAGNAFDLVGERKQTNFKSDSSTGWVTDESFEIKLRNRKKDEAVEIRVVEHLYRGTNWEIRDNSADFTKTDAGTIEFRVTLKPGEERVIKYTAHYIVALAKKVPAGPTMGSDPFGAPVPAPTN
ncbi:MAG: DUF4139 domain-containing protein [Verrucomicrobia bacterium]|nr:DUF4139 domain-containing protein [Verrucomicrobiota bacterium]